MEVEPEALLSGVVDLHVHGGPDLVARRHSDIELAKRARAAGMRAIVLKSHVESTVGRAALAMEAAGLPVYGGIVLNPFVTGGLEPDVVEVSLALGARVVWLPSLGSTAHAIAFGRRGRRWTGLREHPAQIPMAGESLDVDPDEPGTRAALIAICRHVARADALLATGHVDGRFLAGIARIADRAAARLLITHPDYLVPGLSSSAQAELVAEFPSVVLERAAYVTSALSPRPVPIGLMVEAMRATGIERNVLSSDLGQPGNPPYPHGFEAFAADLHRAGIARSELRTMLVDGPVRLLGLSG